MAEKRTYDMSKAELRDEVNHLRDLRDSLYIGEDAVNSREQTIQEYKKLLARAEDVAEFLTTHRVDAEEYRRDYNTYVFRSYTGSLYPGSKPMSFQEFLVKQISEDRKIVKDAKSAEEARIRLGVI